MTQTYEDRGQVLTSSDAGGKATMVYDAADNLVARTDAAGAATFGYDQDNRLARQVGPSSGTTTDWTYTAAGNVAKQTDEGVATISYGYDDQHRTTSEAVADGAGGSLANYTWTRNAAGQVLSAGATCKAGCTATSTSYTYDGLGRLASAKTGTSTVNYAYDGNGNLTKGDGVTNAYNEQNELTSSTTGAGQTTYAYTPRGTLSRTTGPDGTGTASTFDAYGDLTSNGSASYTYDALGRASSASVKGIANTFSYDGSGSEPVSDGKQTYGRTPVGAPLSSTSGGVTSDLVTDGHGDVLAQLSSAGITGSTRYGAYGSPATQGSTGTALGFEGGWTDADGHVMTASRWYSPVLSRFLSADTQENPPTPAVNANRYAYGNDDPLNNRDRSGHSACRDYEKEAVERAEERKEEERAERQIRDRDRRIARHFAEEEAEAAEREKRFNEETEDEARSERAFEEEEDFEHEHHGKTRAEYEQEEAAEAGEGVEYQESESWWQRLLRRDGRFFERVGADLGGGEAGEFGAEELFDDLLFVAEFASFENPSLGDCGAGAKPEEITPKDTAERAERGVQRAVDQPESAPAEDPAAKAASQPKTYHPSESGDTTTEQTSVHGDSNEGAESEVGTSPSAQAARLQGQGDYGGVDDWEDVTLRAGDTVHAGEPGVTGFATSDEVSATVGNDARTLNQGLQIAARNGTYRPGLTTFRLTQDVSAARSLALANPQFGAGGLAQFFVPNLGEVSEPVVTRLMFGLP